MDKYSPIGCFDSGIGGLSIYSQFRKLLPKENLIYYADIKNLPYGNKTTDELDLFARKILDFFKTKNVKAVVIACNTSSALVYDRVKHDYDFKIYPIIQSCAKIIAGYDIKKLGVFATLGTINSHAYSKEIHKYNNSINVKEIACHEWVNIVESGNIETEECIKNVKSLMDEILEFKPDKIILGCTHYPCLMQVLKKFADESIFINPASIFAKYIQNDLSLNNLINATGEGKEEFYVSASPEKFVKNADLFYSIKNKPILV